MNLILFSIDWPSIATEKIHTACSISQTKQILLNTSIDLVINDGYCALIFAKVYRIKKKYVKIKSAPGRKPV